MKNVNVNMNIKQFLKDPAIKRGFIFYSRDISGEYWGQTLDKGVVIYQIKTDTKPINILVTTARDGKMIKQEELSFNTNQEVTDYFKNLIKEKNAKRIN